MRRRVLLLATAMLTLAAKAFAEAPKEGVEADASTRQVAITSSFTGTEILVFGTVENSVQPSAEAGTYDIVIAVEGERGTAIVRKKSEVGGIWVNANALRFASVPNYYAVASTRPIDEFADAAILDANEIGFAHLRLVPLPARGQFVFPHEIAAFKEALIRLKQQERVYVRSDFGVTFIGRSLFRATVALPPNVPVGPLVARVYLFKDGQLLGQYKSRVMLEREGIERYIHDASRANPLIYGIVTVVVAGLAGLASAVAYRRPL